MSSDLRSLLQEQAARPSSPVDVDELFARVARRQRARMAIGVVAVLPVVAGIGVLRWAAYTPPAPVIQEAPDSSLQLDAVAVADAYWKAIADGDAAGAMGLIDPAFADLDQSPFGRASTLEGQLQWYEAVGFRWTSMVCVEFRPGAADCTATAVNDWSEALGVEPITGRFVVEVGDEGITRVDELGGSFSARWSPEVFEPFRDWVQTNHPEDAAVMWAGPDVNDEILQLFAVNTRRFVDAQG